MAKKTKATPPTASVMACGPYVAPDYYKRDYEFNKRSSVRSSLSPWEHRWAGNLAPKEARLANGTSHKFKGVRTGNSYGSRPAKKNKR